MRATVIPKVAEAFGQEHPFPTIVRAYRSAESVAELGLTDRDTGRPARHGWQIVPVHLLARVSRNQLYVLRSTGYSEVVLRLNDVDRAFTIEELLK